MRMVPIVVFVVGMGTAAAAPKPGLQGSYELVAAKEKNGPEQSFPALLKELPDTAWGRMVLTFEGNDFTIAGHFLQKQGRGFSGCRVSAMSSVTWTAKGFKLASKVSAKAVATTFKKLTKTDSEADDDSCNASFDAGVQTLGKQGDRITLTNAKGEVLYLAPVDDGEAPFWTRYIP